MIDNFHEIELLADVLEEHDAHVDVMLRITPGISAHTNKYIQTGQVDSKFGFDLQSGQADEALAKVLENPRIQMKGCIKMHLNELLLTTKFRNQRM